MYTPNYQTPERGFALLLTMMVVAVVLAVGLTLLNITIKQFTLSVTGRESEVAFHVAGSMAECALLYRGDNAYDDAFLLDNSFTTGPAITCGTETESPNPQTSTTNISGAGHYHLHQYEFDYPSGRGSCGRMSIYVFEATSGDINFNFANEGIESASCSQNNTCTVAFARGFNRSCSDLDSLRTVQREFTIRF